MGTGANKPDDIDQGAWVEATMTLPPVFSASLHTSPAVMVLRESIARAIMAERERCAKVAGRHLEVSQQVAARSNLVGYAAEFYGAAKHHVPAAIRKGGHQ